MPPWPIWSTKRYESSIVPTSPGMLRVSDRRQDGPTLSRLANALQGEEGQTLGKGEFLNQLAVDKHTKRAALEGADRDGLRVGPRDLEAGRIAGLIGVQCDLNPALINPRLHV